MDQIPDCSDQQTQGGHECGTVEPDIMPQQAEPQLKADSTGLVEDSTPTETTINQEPNAFIGIRIPSDEIRAKIEEVQQTLLMKDKRLELTFVSTVKNHITLMVMRLDGQEEIERAKKALLEVTQKVVKALDLLNDPLKVKFSGLGNFSKDVLFAKIAEGRNKERLTTMAGDLLYLVHKDIVNSVFTANELPSASEFKGFASHLTIAKISGRSREKKCKEVNLTGIDHSVYAELLDTEFGTHKVDGLELLSMTRPPAEDGYYHCFTKIYFNDQ